MVYHQNQCTTVHGYGILDLCLKDILHLLKPSEDDRKKRMNIISELEKVFESVTSLKDKGAVVRPFGSFASDLYTRWGDLDISIEVSHSSYASVSRNQKQKILREIMKALRRTGVAYYSTLIPFARIPLLTYESRYQNISCDVSIDNHTGRKKSRIFFWISSMDERFRDMVLLIKEWAKAQNINDPKKGTLNSYSLTLLAVFHFQTCNPSILPPLKEVYGENISDDDSGSNFVTEKDLDDVCASNISRFKYHGFGKSNKSSVSQLFVSFFEKFSRIEDFAKSYVISTHTAKWKCIGDNPRWKEKSYSLVIEDPFQQQENAARAVGQNQLSLIGDAFKGALSKFSCPSVLANRNSLLAVLIRTNIGIQHRTIAPGYYSTTSVGMYNGSAENSRHSKKSESQIQSVPRVYRRQGWPSSIGITGHTHNATHFTSQNGPILNGHRQSTSSVETTSPVVPRLDQYQQPGHPQGVVHFSSKNVHYQQPGHPQGVAHFSSKSVHYQQPGHTQGVAPFSSKTVQRPNPFGKKHMS